MTVQHISILPAVHGTAKLVKPLNELGMGEIAINEQTYSVTVTEGRGYELFGCDRDGKGTHYTVNPGLTRCDCPDFTFRSHRRSDGRCKHVKAVCVLVNRGKLPRLES